MLVTPFIVNFATPVLLSGSSLVVIAPVILERAILCMPACSHDFVEWNTTKKIDGDERTSACVATYELVFRDTFRVNHPCYLGFTLDFFGQSCGFHQLLQVLVVG